MLSTYSQNRPQTVPTYTITSSTGNQQLNNKSVVDFNAGSNNNEGSYKPPPAPMMSSKVPTTTNLSSASASEKNEYVWRKDVRNKIEVNNRAIDKSDAHIFYSKRDDPLTNLREVLRTLSNTEAFKYMKQCRLNVAKLKKCWVEVNEEIKSLSRNKEYLESAIDHIRKDLIINKDIIDGRGNRCATEPVRFFFTF